MSRWGFASRIAAGTIGAYGTTSLVAAAGSLLLVRSGVEPVEAVTACSVASFALFAILAMTVFHVHTTTRAWLWLLALGLLSALMIWPGAPR